MEDKIIDGLKDIGYKGALIEKNRLTAAIEEGPKSIEYTQLVSYLTNEIRPLLNIDEEVNPISSPEDSVAFVMEVSSFLKELNCTYSNLTQGHISDRLQNTTDKALLLDYLITELMGSRILQHKKPDKKIELKLQESDEAANLKKVLMVLRFPKPPANITMQQLFQKMCPTVENTVKKVGSSLIGKPAFNGFLSEKQWDVLKGVQNDLHNEYKIRREMLLTRLDVTIQSFQWSDKTKGKDEMFEKIYAEKRKRLKADPDIELADLLAARDEIAIIEKTSSSSVRKNTRSSLNKVIIGAVPDRGGRTSEQAPPPPEMPSWQQRTPGGPGGNRGGRGRGRGRGNFSQGDNRQNYSSGDNLSSGNTSSNYSGGQSSYGGAGSTHSSGSGSTYGDRRSFDSAGSYGSGYDKSTSQGYSTGSYSGGNYNKSSSGGYSSGNYDNKSGSAMSTSGSYENLSSATYGASSYAKSGSGSGSYNKNTSNYSSGRGSYGGDNRSFDSAGSYGKDGYEQNSKRAKTYDSYQSSRNTYSDQYVQEERHNQQYHSKGGGGGGRGSGSDRSSGRGYSNYHRGGRNNY